ncbi:MAG: hypothetical protein JWQ09_1820 [Segetibacter sp.]|nr:hypothetical protein [Segetibacter sp.]
MKLKDRVAAATANGNVKVDPRVDKIDSGRIGAEKREKLRKYKGAILATVAGYRAR